jgi:hypothetical protein
VNSVPTVEVQRVLDDRSRAIRGELAALRIGIARVDIGRLDDVIADRRIIVADRLALGGKPREHRRRRRRAAQRQIESDQHPCPPRLSSSSFIANVVGPVYPRYFLLPTNAAREPNKFRARRQGE